MSVGLAIIYPTTHKRKDVNDEQFVKKQKNWLTFADKRQKYVKLLG